MVGIHRPLDGIDAALVGMHGAVGEEQLDLAPSLPRPPRLVARLAGQAQILGLADARPEEDGVDLRDRREQRALAAADQVAGLDLGGADEPVDAAR